MIHSALSETWVCLTCGSVNWGTSPYCGNCSTPGG